MTARVSTERRDLGVRVTVVSRPGSLAASLASLASLARLARLARLVRPVDGDIVYLDLPS